VHNGLIDKRPALIACCRGTADVADSVTLARALNLEVAVRGGGHNVAGKAAIDAGLMIDLAPMKGIHVDPAARTVRAQGGVLWKELNRETQLHGLATTGGVVASTGIAGLTLGGGIGWLMPKYGLALDNLRSAEMVMADGSVVVPLSAIRQFLEDPLQGSARFRLRMRDVEGDEELVDRSDEPFETGAEIEEPRFGLLVHKIDDLREDRFSRLK
jgi:FAD/FMN-containing dehydrogenase